MVEDIDVSEPINSYGRDSMVAVEVHNWLFQKMTAAISLLNLLHPAMTVEKPAKETETNIALPVIEVN